MKAKTKGLLSNMPVRSAERDLWCRRYRPSGNPGARLVCLGLITLEPADAGRVLRPRLAGQRELRAATAVAGACLPHVSHPFPQLRQLGTAQAGEPQPRVRGPLRSGEVPDAVPGAASRC